MLSGMFFVINEIFLKAVSEIHAVGGYITNCNCVKVKVLGKFLKSSVTRVSNTC